MEAFRVPLRQRAARLELEFSDRDVLPQREAQGRQHRRFDPGTAYFAAALGAMTIAAGEQRPLPQYREPHGRARGQVADVDVSAVGARGNRVDPPAFGRGHAHRPTKRFEWDTDVFHAEAASLVIELPVMDVGEVEVVGQQAESFQVARPAPFLVLHLHDFDL